MTGSAIVVVAAVVFAVILAVGASPVVSVVTVLLGGGGSCVPFWSWACLSFHPGVVIAITITRAGVIWPGVLWAAIVVSLLGVGVGFRLPWELVFGPRRRYGRRRGGRPWPCVVFPATAALLPMIAVLFPLRSDPVVAGARGFPATGNPLVTVSSPGPVTAYPEIVLHRRRSMVFIAWWRWRDTHGSVIVRVMCWRDHAPGHHYRSGGKRSHYHGFIHQESLSDTLQIDQAPPVGTRAGRASSRCEGNNESSRHPDDMMPGLLQSFSDCSRPPLRANRRCTVAEVTFESSSVERT